MEAPVEELEDEQLQDVQGDDSSI